LLKRIGPLAAEHPDITAGDIAALGFDAAGLVSVLVDLGDQADRARRLSRIVLERR
nr:hypothetical protein [Planctomycetota bacterium]